VSTQSSSATQGNATRDNLLEFQHFMKQRKAASQAFVNGDVDPLINISTQVLPATIFGPKGDCVEGATSVNAANANGAKQFQSGGNSLFEVLQQAASDDIAYWAGIQRSTVKPQGKTAMPMDLRVTEIFRRENGAWKLVHRHADPLR